MKSRRREAQQIIDGVADRLRVNDDTDDDRPIKRGENAKVGEWIQRRNGCAKGRAT